MGILLGVLLVAFSAIIIVASNNGDMAIQNARHALSLAESKQLYDAAQTGISEAIAERFQPRSNRYSLISSTTPLHGLSGRLYSDTSSLINANVIATYRYMVLGGANERTAAGVVDTARMTEVTTLQPAFIVSKADACFSDFKAVAGALSIDANGVPSCTSGTQRSLTLVAKLDLSRSSSTKDIMTQLRVVNDDTAISLDTTVFIPATGDGTSVNFETAWQGGSGATAGADLTHVVVDNNGTVTTYPVSGSTLDITGSGDLDETNTNIWFIFNDGLDFRSLYTGTTSLNECFTNSALDCGIVVSEDDTSGSPVNAALYPTFPAGNRVLLDADYPAYANSDSSARDSWYDIAIPASTLRDWYGNYTPAFTLTAKSPDPVAACSVPTPATISANGTYHYNDPAFLYGVTVNSETLSSVNIDFTGNSCANTVALPAQASDYGIVGDTFTLNCGSHVVDITGPYKETYGAYTCPAPPPPPTCSTVQYETVNSAGTYTYNATEPYDVTVNNNTTGTHDITIDNNCSNNIDIYYPDSSWNTGYNVNVDGGSGLDTLVIPGKSADHTPSSGTPGYTCVTNDSCGHEICYKDIEVINYTEGTEGCNP